MSTSSSNITAKEPAPPGQRVAPLWHTALVLALLLATSIGGAVTHHWTGPLTRHMASRHHSHIPMYAFAALWEWLLLALVLWGARLSGTRLRQLLGIRRAGAVEMWTDFAIAIGFWFASLIVLGAVSFLLRCGHANGARVSCRVGRLGHAQCLRGHLRGAHLPRLSAATVHSSHAAHMARHSDFSGVFRSLARL